MPRTGRPPAQDHETASTEVLRGRARSAKKYGNTKEVDRIEKILADRELKLQATGTTWAAGLSLFCLILCICGFAFGLGSLGLDVPTVQTYIKDSLFSLAPIPPTNGTTGAADDPFVNATTGSRDSGGGETTHRAGEDRVQEPTLEVNFLYPGKGLTRSPSRRRRSKKTGKLSGEKRVEKTEQEL
ncbi:unnamed protein product [Amoebophrya sp. A120]|nr:unnamed protein product [Amoebophrya sp. A120]|eukprot:GSA120T00006738001.1